MKVATWIGWFGWFWVLRSTLTGDMHWALLVVATVTYLFIIGLYAQMSGQLDAGVDQEQS